MIQMQTSNIANEYKMSNGRCTFIWLDTYLHYKKNITNQNNVWYNTKSY